MVMNAPFTSPVYAPAERIASALRNANNIVVTAHASPDGDAVGSMLALSHGLVALGKRVALCNVSGFPEYLSWMPVPGSVYRRLKDIPFTPDLAVALDCGDADRLGKALVAPFAALPSVNLDHHLGNPLFGSVDNWAEPQMAATGQMVAAVLAALGVPLTGDIAEAVYVALHADTGGFAFDNTTAEVFELVAYLVHEGLQVSEVRRRMDNQWSEARMRLWGSLMQRFALHCEGRIALLPVPLAALGSYGAMKEDLEGLVEQLRRLKGVEVAALVREDLPQRCKISLRSSGPVDVRVMAGEFGGGGHRNAAGATLEMPLAKAAPAVLQCITKALECGV